MGDKPQPASADKQARSRVKYLGISAVVIIIVSFALFSFFSPPAVPDFELQVNDFNYNPSNGLFTVKGTIGIRVPPKYSYKLTLVSITDGNKTIVLRHYEHGFTYIHFDPTLSNPERAGPDWTFQLWEAITLESKVVQLTFEYEIIYRDQDVLETGTEVFSVNVE